ncbi:hypothetical protein [Brachybacterium paraconglomeratum]|uniref:hypothetical protein n=1 Tax=Brachybacterium paraconglomeratum TaxID=173362 RepID=UPI0021A65D4D|nr:hypothetical protein [Brachybacterium paraconglomeratum]MCT1908419.1 hypothetical protein [Brachybacterium paraconglomeratum]
MTKKRARRAREDSVPFSAMVDQVEQERPPGSGQTAIPPGSISGGDMEFLRHTDGELLRPRESGLTLDDAKNCVRAGAEVYVNPDLVEFDVRGTGFHHSVQRWLSGKDVRQFMDVDYENADSRDLVEISLYAGESGRMLIHLAGHFRWPNGVDSPA